MTAKALTLSLAALVAVGALSTSAEADHRKKHRRQVTADQYYAGPPVVRGVPGLRLLFGDYALTEEEFDALYGTDDGQAFDESYYEPKPVEQAKPRKKPVTKDTTAAAPKPAAKTTEKTVSVAKTASVAEPAEGSTTTASTTKPATAAVSCDKAQSIIAGYGFSSAKPESCAGKIYAFNATRAGKTFAVKVDSASGELTEVKKLD